MRQVRVPHLAQVVDVNLLDAELLSLEACGLQLLALPQVRSEGHHLAPVLILQPRLCVPPPPCTVRQLPLHAAGSELGSVLGTPQGHRDDR